MNDFQLLTSNLQLSQLTKILLKKYDFHPKKRWGQHFLINPHVLERIIEAAELSKEDIVIEIGTGLGFLTKELANRIQKIITVEIDQKLLKIAKEFLKDCTNVEFVRGDILDFDLKLTNHKIIGNLPYYITAPIIEKILEVKPKLAVLTVQKEVAERIVARPGSKAYGSFTIFVQYYAEVRLHSLVHRSAFYPQPKVSSAIVILRPYEIPPFKIKNEKLFFDIVRAAFQQRRKKIKNSLAEFNLEGCEIDLNRRPETLSIEEFRKLSSYIANKKQ